MRSVASGRFPVDLPVPSDVHRTADAERESVADDAELAVPRFGHRLGRYQLLLPLAQGGMGIVFAGRLVGSHGVERLVAIKTLRPITSPSHRAALLREARLTSRLHHRNVVATLDLDEVGDMPYVVMELVDGVSLSKLLARLRARGERLPTELATWIAMQCAFGLHAAHELSDGDGRPLGLVHRDISPQNILLATSGEVKLADFGIAKFVGRDESTATGTIKGKFGYMSPEQGESDDVDRRSDIFSLGIVLWEALTGERLFSTDSPARTLLRVREHQPVSPADFRSEVGKELAAITLRCLEKDRARRYPTAAEVADALRGALRSRGALVDETDLAGLVRALFGTERMEFMSRLRSSAAVAASRRAPATRRPAWRQLSYRALAVGGIAAAGLCALSFGGVRSAAPPEQTAHVSALPGPQPTAPMLSSTPETPSSLPPSPPALPLPPAAAGATAPASAAARPHGPRAGAIAMPRAKPAPSVSTAPAHPATGPGNPFETL